MLHGKLETAYRKLAQANGQDQQQALEELLKELRETEAKRLELEKAESKDATPSIDEPADSAESSADSSSDSQPKSPKGHGRRRQNRLEAVEQVYELAEKDLGCTVCGGVLQPFGDQFEEYEEISVLERRYFRRIVKRRKYRCQCNSCVVTTPGPSRLVPGGRYDLSFAVQIAVDKYLDHLALERQTRIMGRLGLEVSSQSLWDQIEALARILESPYKALGRQVLEAPLLHADETRWPRLDGKGVVNWTVWARCTPEIAHYSILSSKSAKTARRLFQGYQGIVVADGYEVYRKLSRDGPKFQLANCWAHTRRKFEEIQDNYPAQCRRILSLIGRMYQIEREVPGPFPGDEESQRLRLTLRQEQTQPILSEIWDWACTEVGLPRSSLGKAVRYMLKRWEGFTLFVANPLIPLDNNAAERSLRGPVIGRKIHYGSKSKRGTQVAAIFYTLLETAKLRGVEPAHYLKSAAEAALENPEAIVLPQDLVS